MSAEQRAFLSDFEHQVVERLSSAPKLDSLAESDLADETILGLDTAYRIVRGHHGDVTYSSKPGETRFQVRLPLQKTKGGPL